MGATLAAAPLHTVSIRADGRDELLIANGNLVIRRISWQNPTSITINGVAHALSYSNNLSDPIPLTLPEGFQFVQTGGRTALYPVETPVGLLVGADDELLGPDTYTWKLVAVPEPSAALLFAIGAAGLMAARNRSRSGARRSK